MGIIFFELPLVLAHAFLGRHHQNRDVNITVVMRSIAAFIISAIVTPTVDPYTQTLMAMPLILFYEVGIWFAWFTEKRRAKSAVEIIDAPPSWRRCCAAADDGYRRYGTMAGSHDFGHGRDQRHRRAASSQRSREMQRGTSSRTGVRRTMARCAR